MDLLARVDSSLVTLHALACSFSLHLLAATPTEFLLRSANLSTTERHGSSTARTSPTNSPSGSTTVWSPSIRSQTATAATAESPLII